MPASNRVHPIREFLGSVHIFSATVSELLQERLHQLMGGQLTFPQLKLLKLIAHTPTAYSIGEIAAFLGVSNAAASKAVDRLVRRGLLQRGVSENDRRIVRVRVTDNGFAVLREYDAVTDRALEGVFHGFSVEALKKTAELLDRLSVSVVDEDGMKEESCFRCGIYFRDRCLLRTTERRICRLQLRLASSGLSDARTPGKPSTKRVIERDRSK